VNVEVKRIRSMYYYFLKSRLKIKYYSKKKIRNKKSAKKIPKQQSSSYLRSSICLSHFRHGTTVEIRQFQVEFNPKMRLVNTLILSVAGVSALRHANPLLQSEKTHEVKINKAPAKVSKPAKTEQMVLSAGSHKEEGVPSCAESGCASGPTQILPKVWNYEYDYPK
jgi:hypothetical protein